MKKATSLFLSIVMLISIISSVNLSALAQEVESFTFTPAAPYIVYENTNGWYDDWEDVYNYNPPDFNEGDIISVNFKDIGTVNYTFSTDTYCFTDDSGEELNVRTWGFSFNGTGKTTFEVELFDYAKTIDVPVTIIENPVVSFTYTPIKPFTIIEGTHGWLSEFDNQWYYDVPDYQNGDIISVTFNDIGTVDYVYDENEWGFFNENGEELITSRYSFTFDGLGETTFTLELNDYGKKTDVPVTIIENPVASFTFTPAAPYEITEETNGWFNGETGNFCYFSPSFNTGDTIAITYKDSSRKVFIYSSNSSNRFGFYTLSGEKIEVYSHEFEFSGTGETTFKVELADYGKTTDVPVTIVASPVDSFTYNPVKPFELVYQTNGIPAEDNGWYYNAPYPKNGDVISVNYKAEGTVNYTYVASMGGFYDSNSNELDVWTHGFLYEGIGETTFTVELADYGKSIDVPITIIENPVKGAAYIPIKPFELYENGHGFEMNDEDNVAHWFYYIPDFNDGDIIRLTLNDNSTVDYSFDSETGAFINESSDAVYVEGDYYFEFEGLGNTTFSLTVKEYAVDMDVPVSIVENPLSNFIYTPISPIVLSQEKDGEYDEEEGCYWYYYEPQDGDSVKLIFNDGSSDIYTFDSKAEGKYYYEGGFYNSNGEELGAMNHGFSFKATGKTSFDVLLFDYGMRNSVPVTIVSDANPEPPVKVTGLKTSARGANGVNLTLSWNAVDGATGYNVYGYNKPADSWTLLDTVTTNKYISPTTPGYEYYFRVAAVNGDVEGTPSDALHTCAACETMDAPSVIAANDKTIQVDWNLVGSHGYVVMWSKDSTFKTGVSSKYITGHSKSNYTISVPSGAGQYYVRVRAWRNWETGYVYGSWSEGVKAGQTIARVTGLKTSARGANGVNLTISWNAQAAADSYNVYGYNKANDSWTLLDTVSTNKYISPTTPGYEYIFRVAAVEDEREGVPSERLHTCAACDTMKAPTVQKNGSQIKVNWEIVGSHGYVVMWSTDPTFKTGVSSKYITGHSVNNYTITGINSNQTYYVRVRAWRNWDTGYVYGSWSTGTAAK